MKNLLILAFICFSAILNAQMEITNPEIIQGCWTDSYEEKTQDTLIFRPCEYKKFPPSRFRFKMKLNADYTCSWYYLSPDDAHHMKEGTWNFDSDTRLLKIIDENAEKIKVYKLVKVEKDKLRIIQLKN